MTNDRVLSSVLVLLLATASTVAQEQSAPLFERDIRPLLKASCFQCHGEEKDLQGGLDLRLRRFMITGGDSGPAIVPHEPESSYLIERLRSGEMPPGDKEKLSPQQLALVERWIAGGANTAHPEPEEISGRYFTQVERRHWAFQVIGRPEPPEASNSKRIRTSVDAFVLAKLESAGHSFAPDADKRTLIRRASFDLTGLPPTPEEVERFVSNDDPLAYEQMVDRLLASSHYGERWGRHWLDIAGYADSDGAEGDKLRHHAYRYRDYVIRSFNADKPFDQFITEQLAGDELAGPLKGAPTPEQAEKLIATGFLQMAPDATSSAEDRLQAHDQLVADTIQIVSSSLLGLTIGCARCHDHRFDPISQDDYYRFRAIFEPALNPRNWQGGNRQIEYETEEDRESRQFLMRKQQEVILLRVAEQQLEKLPEDRREAAWAAFQTPEEVRTPEQRQLLVDSKLNITVENVREFDRQALMELNRLRGKFPAQQKGRIQAVNEASAAASTFLFERGDPSKPKYAATPGELEILAGDSELEIPENDPSRASTGRRLAYARRLTDGGHPLVARVIVNRVWMHHFGRGLCATPSDFGLQSETPSHPELLDWLARDFMDNGWSLKRLHKQMVCSTAYRQSAQRSESLQSFDPDNRLLGGFSIRRLEAEIVRDAVLAVSGQLNRKPFGVAVPVMSDTAGEIVIGVENTNGGIPIAVLPMFGEERRRSIYVQARRTTPLTFMETFDSPQMEPNCEARTATTVAPQSLVLMNSPFILRQSRAFAQRVLQEAGGDDAKRQIETAWRLALSRSPTTEELAEAAELLEAQASHFRANPPRAPKPVEVPGSRSRRMAPQPLDVLIAEASKSDPHLLALSVLCQMLISSNEFLYVH
ncbi:MAG: DUF1553 domain-containing protein [Pirellulaceae bacterium]